MIKTNILIDNNIWFNRIKNPNDYFKKKLIKLSKVMPKLKKKYEISILLSSSKEIKELNKKFRKKNKASDVLSFPFWNKLTPEILKNDEIYLGDIAICFEIINGRAKFVQEPFLKAGGSDANGRMVVNSPAGSLHPSVMCYAPEGGQNYVVSIEFF